MPRTEKKHLKIAKKFKLLIRSAILIMKTKW